MSAECVGCGADGRCPPRCGLCCYCGRALDGRDEQPAIDELETAVATRDVRRDALAYAAAKLEETGESGTRNAAVLLRQLADDER